MSQYVKAGPRNEVERLGGVLLCLGILLGAVLLRDNVEQWWAWVLTAIPVVIGATLIGYSRWNERKCSTLLEQHLTDEGLKFN